MLNTLFPPCCFHCSKEGSYLCVPCKKELKPHPETCPNCHRISPGRHMCLNCRTHMRDLTGLIVGFQYTGPLKQLIWKLKYAHARVIAPFLAKRIYHLVITHPALCKALHANKLIISHVPSHRRKEYMVKGYNQSTLLAESLSDILKVPHKTLRKKIRHTKSQARLSRKKRLANLRQAFLPLTQNIMGDETILIVDDVTTTGSTIYELAQCMREEYPECTIWGCVLGRHGR